MRITRARTGDGSRILRNRIDMIFLHLYEIRTSVVVVIFHPNMSKYITKGSGGRVPRYPRTFRTLSYSEILCGERGNNKTEQMNS